MILFTLGVICVIFWVVLIGFGLISIFRFVSSFIVGLVTFRPIPWVVVIGVAALMASYKTETIQGYNAVSGWWTTVKMENAEYQKAKAQR